MTSGTAVSAIAGEEYNILRNTLNYRKFPFHLTFLPEFLEFSDQMYAFRKFDIYSFSQWKLSQKIFKPFDPVVKFGIFGRVQNVLVV